MLIEQFTTSDLFEIITDGRTVWINNAVLLGRFSRMGIDVHVHGRCLEGSCFPGPCYLSHWQQFKELMQKHHNIEVEDKYMPHFLRERESA